MGKWALKYCASSWVILGWYKVQMFKGELHLQIWEWTVQGSERERQANMKFAIMVVVVLL